MTETGKKDGALTGIIYQFLATYSSFVAGSLFYIYLAKFYSTTEVGNVALMLATVGIFMTIFSLGLSQASMHFISYHMGLKQNDRIRAFTRKTLIYGFISSILAFISLMILSPFISSVFFHNSSYGTVVNLLGLYLLVYLLFTILTGVLYGFQNFKMAGKISMTTSLVSYSLAAFLLYNFATPESIVVGWFIGYAIGTLILGIVVYRKLQGYETRQEKYAYKPVFAYSVPIIFSGIIGTAATYIDQFLVAFFINVSTLGIYNLALLIVSALGLFLAPLFNVLMPKLSELFSLGDRASILAGLRVTTTLVSLIYVPAALGIAALSGRVLLALSTNQYLPATVPAIIFLVLYALFVSRYVFVQAVYSVKKTRILVLTASGTLVSNVALSFYLIPIYGITGAAVANSSVAIVSFAILFWYTRLQGYLSIDVMATIKVWAAAGVMAITIYFLSGVVAVGIFYLILLVVIGVLLYFIFIKLLRVMNITDKAWLFTLFTGRYQMFVKILNKLL